MDQELFSRLVRRYRNSLFHVFLASSLFNLLVFAGSAYLMLVYDSVLPSRSVPTLMSLLALLILAYAFQYVFDVIRGEALHGIARGVYDDLAPAVNHAATVKPLQGKPGDGDGQQPMRDLDQIHSFLSGSGPSALCDLPWVLVFMLILFALHWWLGVTALAGVCVLAAIALWTGRTSQAGTKELTRLGNVRAAMRLQQMRLAETAAAMGMEQRLRARAFTWESDYLSTQSSLGRAMVRLGGAGRAFRLLLQSLILTVGALLVINDKASAGVIFASSVLAGRALAPVDQVIANWRNFAASREGWSRIVEAICAFPIPAPRSVLLPRPVGDITLREVWIVPPGRGAPVVSGVSLNLKPGQALAVIGPSAAGKTSLIKGLLGIWPLSRGEIRIDGATHDQWDREALGAHMGYVAQTVELIEGTIGENISRFDPTATSDEIMAAARSAGMHETILAFPNGYETRLSSGGVELSAGLRQRVGLARALFRDPFLLVLDEANSNLDAAGDAALAQAIKAVRARNGIVVMVTHRPATLGPISHVAVLGNGRLIDYGERDPVMARTAKGPKRIASKPGSATESVPS